MTPEAERLRYVKEAVARRMVDALIQRDASTIGELISADIVYHFPGRSSVAGTYHGRSEVLGLFGAFGRLFDDPPALSSHDVVASEAHVVELATYRAVRNGTPHEWHAVRICHIDEEHIVEAWLMIDDLYAFDAWLAAS